MLNAEFQVSLNSDRFGMAEAEEAKMKDDLDCFLQWCISDGQDVKILKIVSH